VVWIGTPASVKTEVATLNAVWLAFSNFAIEKYWWEMGERVRRIQNLARVTYT
jgi:hypothetical protein